MRLRAQRDGERTYPTNDTFSTGPLAEERDRKLRGELERFKLKQIVESVAMSTIVKDSANDVLHRCQLCLCPLRLNETLCVVVGVMRTQLNEQCRQQLLRGRRFDRPIVGREVLFDMNPIG